MAHLEWRRISSVLPAGLALLALGCGDEPGAQAVEKTVSAAVPALESRSAAAAPGVTTNQAPRIQLVTFEPPHPGIGETVRARVTARDRDGDSLWFRYEWTLDGKPASPTSSTSETSGARSGSGT